jgi:predicted secreted protein
VSQSSEFCRHNTLCCFSTSICCLCHRVSPETFGYTLVSSLYDIEEGMEISSPTDSQVCRDVKRTTDTEACVMTMYVLMTLSNYIRCAQMCQIILVLFNAELSTVLIIRRGVRNSMTISYEGVSKSFRTESITK